MRVKLYSNEEYCGKFRCMDGNLNLVLENCTFEGSLLSEVFIRGNNVMYITPTESLKGDLATTAAANKQMEETKERMV